jgi:hypothetical protein
MGGGAESGPGRRNPRKVKDSRSRTSTQFALLVALLNIARERHRNSMNRKPRNDFQHAVGMPALRYEKDRGELIAAVFVSSVINVIS